jgi:hypothetical protein
MMEATIFHGFADELIRIKHANASRIADLIHSSLKPAGKLKPSMYKHITDAPKSTGGMPSALSMKSLGGSPPVGGSGKAQIKFSSVHPSMLRMVRCIPAFGGRVAA